ncbi:hypothetical protein L596_026393 [Steinernema carpocapsae]|uniref:Ribosome biogenesis protein NSA2 homolog n=1 Tax=Steinernema carpocapsae TaxID=34508 RepID=A0A4U5M180_STECR|nr:hypothetical protein L596_026393 [Steinernema carpocapsae]
MPQNEHIELHRKRHGRRLDHEERTRKKIAREAHKRSKIAKKLRGHKAKLYHKKRYSEKVQMRKLLKQHEEKDQKGTVEEPQQGAVPAYLLDRQQQTTGTVLSNMIKQKRKEKAGKYQVPIPKVRAVSDAEAFKVVQTGKTRRKGWKRMVTKVTFVGDSFTRKPAKFERFIRPMGLRFKKHMGSHVVHFGLNPRSLVIRPLVEASDPKMTGYQTPFKRRLSGFGDGHANQHIGSRPLQPSDRPLIERIASENERIRHERDPLVWFELNATDT